MTGAAAVLDGSAVLQALQGPAGLYVEAGCPPPRRRLPLHLVMRSRTAHAYPLAAAFVAALRARAGLLDRLAETIELALHEAVVNAVLHGNLGLGSEGRSTPEGFASFCEQVAAALDDPCRGGRLVDVAACWSDRCVLLAVADQGAGFDPGRLDATGAAEAAHGRGLPIMRMLADGLRWNQRRRRLLLGFRREAACA